MTRRCPPPLMCPTIFHAPDTVVGVTIPAGGEHAG